MSSSDTPKTILLKGEPRYTEATAKAGEAIKPGLLLQTHTDGTFKKHATAGGSAQRLFAKEADYIGGGIDTVYADGENVIALLCDSDDMVYGWLKAGQSVAIGTFLESAGDGSLRDVGTAGEVVAMAAEAVNNNPGSGGLPVRIKVEVL